LIGKLCAQKLAAVSDYSFGDGDLTALLTVPEARAHPRYREVVRSARKAFPYAECFSTDGFFDRAPEHKRAKPMRKQAKNKR
jgi:hypothetical protein